ncbi:hypothetical protein Hanom_Chr09g00794861 [Helianthus anomalus]
MDGVNELDKNCKISNLLHPDAEKQTYGRTLQKWPTLRDKLIGGNNKLARLFFVSLNLGLKKRALSAKRT